MLNIPDEVKALFKNGSAFKNFHVHFPNGENADLNNDDIVAESVQFTESICSKEVFQFGLSERSQIEFECVGVQNIFGMTIECAIEICLELLEDEAQFITDHPNTGNESFLDPQICTYNGRNMYRVPYGRFIIESCPRSQGAMKHRKVNAYSANGGENVIMSPFLKFKFNSPLWQSEKGMIQNVPLLLACNKNDISDISVTETEIPTIALYGSIMRSLSWDDGDVSHTISFRRSAGDLYVGYIDGWTDMRNDSTCLFRFVCDVDDTTVTPILNRMAELNAPTEVINTVRGILTVFYLNKANVDFGNSVVYAFENAEDTGYIYAYGNETGSLGICFNSGGYDRVVIDAGTTSSETFTVAKTISNERAYKYTLTGTDELKQNIKIEPTGALYTYNTYTNALDFAALVDGYTEIHGQFRKPSRNGNAEYISVSKTSPVAMTPAEYSELWWDEFDVDPVGTVIATYNDIDAGQEQTVAFSVGTGQSTYSMTDNYFLKNLSLSASDLTDQTLEEYVQTLLESHFVPHLGSVSFTPVTLDALGLPYLESGDYLEIDDADGGTVGTYILARTLSGIQTLTDSIESKGGEVLGNG